VLRGLWSKKNAWEEAFYRLARANPFPGVMGRVCPAPCQSKCNRQYKDETIGINAIEMAIGEYAIENNLTFTKPEKETGKRVAVVGSGPAGLSCAYQLRLRGHSVVLLESNTKLGGMMRYGIMGYRVKREVLDAEIQRILDLGVEVRTGVKVGRDVTLDELSKEYDAVFLGVGAQVGRQLPLPGAAGTPYVTNAIDFLKEFEVKREGMTIGKHVVVIGDGDVAMDVARLALRLGSKSTLLSGVAREDMNCSAYEFKEADVEGTTMQYQVGSVEVVRDGDRVTGLKCIKTQKKAKGEEGWNHPVPFFRYKTVEGSGFTLDGIDMVVFAVGQGTDMAGLESTTNNTPFFQVDHNYLIKGMDNVFGGGDAVKITLLTTAIGHGRRAAEAMELLFQGQPLPRSDRPTIVKYEKLKHDYFVPKPQQKRSLKHPDVVKGSWVETLVPLAREDVVKEADRCMSCGLCFECNQCLLFCPQGAIEKFKGNPEGQVMFTRYERCVGCHICSEVCPTGFIDMGMGHG
jgi:NADPH-dependent glutamate synthase beta subunit-like oxidoreductase/Pyruvate/2-oxoacid:ferredoxin oxidoreductase delta subunit